MVHMNDTSLTKSKVLGHETDSHEIGFKRITEPSKSYNIVQKVKANISSMSEPHDCYYMCKYVHSQ